MYVHHLIRKGGAALKWPKGPYFEKFPTKEGGVGRDYNPVTLPLLLCIANNVQKLICSVNFAMSFYMWTRICMSQNN